MLSLLASNNFDSVKEILTTAPHFLNVKSDPSQNLSLLKHCHKSDTSNQIVRESDGTILNYNKVVCYSGEFCETYSYFDFQNKENTVFQDILRNLSNYEVQEFLDGTLIRYFYHNNRWQVSTKGHTDASKAKWSSEKSFLQLFQEVLVNYPEFSTDVMDKNHTYVFLLQHMDNKIICPITENKIYLLEVYNNSTLLRNESLCSPVKVDSPKHIEVTPESLYIFLDLHDETSKGVYLRHKETGHRFFILNKLYEERQRLKGNTLNINKQYLDLRSSNRHMNFVKEFPEYTTQVAELERNIHDNVRYIHNLYMTKHIKRENITMSPSDYKYVYSIHGHYIRTREIITPQVVCNLLFLIDPYFGLVHL